MSRYIHRNPVDAKSPFVDNLADWPWSSYPSFIGWTPPFDWLVTDTTYALFGRGRKPTRYQRFVEAGVDEATARFYERQRQPPVLARESFRDWALAMAKASDEVPRHQHRPWRDPDELIAAVASRYGVSPVAITARSRTTSALAQARQRALWLCREETAGLTLREIGEHFGGIHYTAVNQSSRRLKASTNEHELNEWRRRTLKASTIG